MKAQLKRAAAVLLRRTTSAWAETASTAKEHRNAAGNMEARLRTQGLLSLFRAFRAIAATQQRHVHMSSVALREQRRVNCVRSSLTHWRLLAWRRVEAKRSEEHFSAMRWRCMVHSSLQQWRMLSKQRREGCLRLESQVHNRSLVTAVQMWLACMRSAAQLKALADRHFAKALVCSALQAWRDWAQVSQRMSLLPAVFEAWKSEGRCQHVIRRFQLVRGLREWRRGVRRKWAMRRRRSIADLLGRRRLLQSALLAWQLQSLMDGIGPGCLVDRWSDSVTESARPLVPLWGAVAAEA